MFRIHKSLLIVSILMILTLNVSSNVEQKLKCKRRIFLKQERYQGIGSHLKLSDEEKKANKIIMKLKFDELEKGFKNPLEFNPARNFLEAVVDVEKTPIFKLLKAMPKGAVLHGHDVALVSVDYVLKNLTYRDNVYAKIKNKTELLELRFSNSTPSIDSECEDCEWTKLEDKRKNESNETVDTWLLPQLSLNKNDAGLDVNSIWNRFMQQFGRLTPLITYEEAWKDYFYQTLLEFHEDNVSYLEFRGLLNDVYRLNGTCLKGIEVANLYVQVLNRFKREHKDFFNAKFIYAPLRFVNNTSFKQYSNMISELLDEHRDFIAGFDLVGQEDIGNTLRNLTKSLLGEKRRIKFYFHAGETKWSGFHSDYNLIDALLLGTKRIGHGYAITKHPKVAEYIKRKNIGIELCPISNQVLGLVKDMRNHPATTMFTDNFPIVIAPDDPGFWGAKGVTYDWYEAFMGIAAKWQDLRLLKQLALNSIEQTSLKRSEKFKLKTLWEGKWKIFIDDVIKYGGDFSKENIEKVDKRNKKRKMKN